MDASLALRTNSGILAQQILIEQMCVYLFCFISMLHLQVLATETTDPNSHSRGYGVEFLEEMDFLVIVGEGERIHVHS
jgi:hypothetical protein